jgi:hypothetical protein
MTNSNTAVATAPRSFMSTHAFKAPMVLAVAILVGSAHATSAQPAMDATPVATQPAPWEFLVSSGALVPTGVQRDVIKNAPLTVAQLSYLVRPLFAVTGSFGWARSHDVASAVTTKLDVFTYDLGGEARAPQWRSGHAVTFNPFAGAGVGGRSYNYRSLDVDATRNVSAYAAVGGEMGLRRVHVRLEVRDYVGGFKPLAGGGQSDTRNDVVMMVGLRIGKR